MQCRHISFGERGVGERGVGERGVGERGVGERETKSIFNTLFARECISSAVSLSARERDKELKYYTHGLY